MNPMLCFTYLINSTLGSTGHVWMVLGLSVVGLSVLAFVRSIPNKFPPIWGDDTITQTPCRHSTMALIRAQSMTTAAQGSKVTHLITGKFTGLDMIDMGGFFSQFTTTANTAITITLKHLEACLLPYFAGLSVLWHTFLNYYCLIYAVLINACRHSTKSFAYFKRFNRESSHADLATVANTGQTARVNNSRLHFATADNSLIPHDRKLTRPTTSARHAIAYATGFGVRVYRAAHVKIDRQIGIVRGRFNLGNVTIMPVRESRHEAVNHQAIINDLQCGNDRRLNRSAPFLNILCALSDRGESIRRIHEQLPIRGNGRTLAPFGWIIPGASCQLLLFERDGFRSEGIKEQRFNSNDLDTCGENVTHAVPDLSFLLSTTRRLSQIRSSALLSGVTNKKQPPCVSSRLFRTDGVTAKRLLFIDDNKKRLTVLNAYIISDMDMKVNMLAVTR